MREEALGSMTNTKNAAQLPVITELSATERIITTDTSGQMHSISRDNLAKGINSPLHLDGVFIMYHAKSDDYPRMVKPHKWTSLQTSGEIADGVVVVEGGKVLVVAPTECDSAGLLWSSAAMSGGATTTTDRLTAMNDWNGKANTAEIIAKSTSTTVNNTAAYAPGFCNLYSRVNVNNKGLTAGKWWLPSAGELMMIYANMTKINYALSLITGATQLDEVWYWCSTENSAPYAWYITLYAGTLGCTTKTSVKYRVRPVSAFIS